MDTSGIADEDGLGKRPRSSYQWLADGTADIAGATANLTYMLVARR